MRSRSNAATPRLHAAAATAHAPVPHARVKPDPTLPNAHVERVDLAVHELDIGAARNHVLDERSDNLDGGIVVWLEGDRVRIAHAHAVEAAMAGACIDVQLAFETGLAHGDLDVDLGARSRLDLATENASVRRHGQRCPAGALGEIAGHAAQAVAAHFRARTVGVAHDHPRGARRTIDDEDAIRADAATAVTHVFHQRIGELDPAEGGFEQRVIDDHEVVAQSLPFFERELHRRAPTLSRSTSGVKVVSTDGLMRER